MSDQIYVVLVVLGSVLTILGVWIYVWEPKYGWRATTLRLLAKHLCHTRVPLPENEVVREVSETAGVPVTFAEEYLEAVSRSYGVPVGYILPTDRFAIELALPRKLLPTGIADRTGLQGGRDHIDGDQLVEVVTWEWYGDHNPGLPVDKLRELASRSDLDVSDLCRELYRLDMLEK